MKKDRNYMPPYPVYPMPGYGMNPNMINPNMMSPDINNLEQRINILEKKVAALESNNPVSYSNKYTDSNFHMM